MTDIHPEIDWREEGKKHFVASKLHPEKPPARYPTQDVHTPKDEADFIAGYQFGKAEWERGGGLNGLAAYIEERDGKIILREANKIVGVG